jgi:hypothetical protein
MFINYWKLGPICRTTVLRPTAPRPPQAAAAAPNPPAAAQQQQQQNQAPNAGGIIKWKKTIFT